MKLTTVLLAVMLLVGGISCVTKDKTETNIPKEVLKEIPVKEEKAELPPSPPRDNIQICLPMIVKSGSEPVIIGSSVYTIGCDIIPPPIENEDSIGIKEDDSDVFLTCNLETEAEFPGGTNAWLRYLHGNVQVPQEVLDSEIDTAVVVQFVVDEEGFVCEAKAISGSMMLGAEVVRVINQSDKWIPAKRFSTDQCIRSIKRQPFIVRFEEEE